MADRYEYKGAAAQAKLQAGISAVADTGSLDVSTNWPTGSIGSFLIVIDPGKSNEEKIICSSRSGNALTFLTRGADGTSANTHAVNAVVKHVLGARDIDLVNRHAADTSQDDHTQYVHVDSARTISANHTFSGTVVFSGSPNFSGSPTFGGNPAFSGTPTFSGTPAFSNMGLIADVSQVNLAAKAAGTSPKPARADHKHDLDITAITNSIIPAGYMILTASASVPAGWLLCNGQFVSRATYPALFTAIGTGYGAGDGVTTFNVPDLRDRFLSGGGTTRTHASAGGIESVTLGVGNLPSHAHDMSHGHSASQAAHTHTPVQAGSAYKMVISSPNVEQNNAPANPGGGGNTQVTYSWLDAAQPAVTVNSFSGNTGSVGSGSSFSIIPKYAAFNVLIKAH